MSIAGFDPAAYEGDLDEDMKEAGNTTYIVFGLINGLFMFFFFMETRYVFYRCTRQVSCFGPIFSLIRSY